MNPHADAVSMVVEVGGHTHWAEAVPAIGGRAIPSHGGVDSSPPTATAETRADGFVLENDFVCAFFDAHGNLTAIEHKPISEHDHVAGRCDRHARAL